MGIKGESAGADVQFSMLDCQPTVRDEGLFLKQLVPIMGRYETRL